MMDALVENIISVVLVILGLAAMLGSAYLKYSPLQDAGFGVLSAGLALIQRPAVSKP